MNKSKDNATSDEILLQISSKSTSVISSKNSTNSTEEFYSPNASFEETKEAENDDQKMVDTKEIIKIEKLHSEEKSVEVPKKTKIMVDAEPKISQSPRARRSYKRE